MSSDTGAAPRLVAGIPYLILLFAIVFGVAIYIGVEALFIVLTLSVLLVGVIARRPVFGLYMAAILMPLEAAGRVLPESAVLTWAKVALLVTLMAVLATQVYTRSKIRLPEYSWLLFGVYAIAVVATSLWSSGSSLWGLVALLGQMAVVLLIANLVTDKRSFHGLLWAIVIGSIPVVAVGMMDISTGSSVLGTVASQSYASSQVAVFRITATFYDPNALGRYLAFALLCTAAMMTMQVGRRFAPLLIPLLLGQAFCLVYTFSRGAILALGVGALVYLLLGKGTRSRVVQLVLGVGAVALLMYAFPEPLSLLLARLTGGTGGIAVDASRVQIWLNGIDAFMESPLLGVGPDNVAMVLGRETGALTSPHSLYLEALIGLGVLGALAFFGFIYSAARSAARVGSELYPEARVTLSILAMVLASGVTLHGFRSNELWVCLGMMSALGLIVEPPLQGEQETS